MKFGSEKIRLLVLLLAVGVWPAARLCADEGGNRVLFPQRPMPVFDTNAPSDWASSNLISVAQNAGGNCVVSNLPGVMQYPHNQPEVPTPDYKPSYVLAYSAFGHVVTGNRPDYYLGDPLIAPTNEVPAGWRVNWASMASSNITGGIFYEASVQRLYASIGGPATVRWVFTDGRSNIVVLRNYLISSTPSRRPYRIYWTEPPYNAPTVDLQGRHVEFHWNNEIPAVVTNSLGQIRGLFVDDMGKLHAAPGPDPQNAPLQGMLVMQYFKTGDLRDQVPGGVIVVEVRRPEVNTLAGEIGKRLLPKDSPYGYRGLDAHVTRGTDTPAFLYQHQGQYSHSPKNGWVFPVRPSIEAPWMSEIYWEEPDQMGTLWPYELDWYAAAWPEDSQPYIRGSNGKLGAEIALSPSLSPKLEDAQQPPGHAILASDGVFHTTSEGYSLLRFSANDNIWFQPIRSIYHTNALFGLDPIRWPIGTQLQPALGSEAIQLDGDRSEITVASYPEFGTNNITLECWLNVSNVNRGKLSPVLSRSLSSNSWDFLIAINETGWLTAKMQSGETKPQDLFELRGPAPADDIWMHVALVVQQENATLYVNGAALASSSFAPREPSTNTHPLQIGWGALHGTNYTFSGRIDEIRIWTKALSESEVAMASRHCLTSSVPELLTWFPVERDGEYHVLRDVAGGRDASIRNAMFTSPGANLPGVDARFEASHGYVYDPANRAPYNAAIYSYPTKAQPEAESHVFGVNSGLLEVWWGQRMQQDDMPLPVYFPAVACLYSNVWATNNAEQIILASGRGSPAFQSGGTPSIYGQNDASAPGYNPNEEHAILGQDRGGWVAYALRDDLNIPSSSPPFVLVNRSDPETSKPAMLVCRVLRTNEAFPAFAYNALVGDPLRGPRPLDLLPNAAPTRATTPWAWRDRALTWWAVGAGAGDTGTASITMTNYYPMQIGFWFPQATDQPIPGAPIPWLPLNGNPREPTSGTPQPVQWTISWPSEVPSMKVGQTLTRAKDGLPEIWNQASVDIAFQQSAVVGNDPEAVSVRLFDPTVAQEVALSGQLSDYGFAPGAGGNIYTRQGMTYFHNLPPDLSDRFYYDPTRHTLRLIGKLVGPATGEPWLLVNRLSSNQRDELKAICSSQSAQWSWMIDSLARNVVEVAPNAPFDSLALAAVGRGAGFVTLAFNNSTNLSPGAPISVEVLKVKPELHSGFLVPLKDPWNLLSEQMNILFSESFAGDADLFEFQWVAVDPPTDGSVPGLPSGNPASPYAQESGLTRLRIGGQGATLQDLVNRFFTVRYHAVPGSPAAEVVGTNWGPFTEFALAEGWVQRVMFSITPFEQRLQDLYNNPAETRVSMIQQAGRPYVGNVALNMDAINEVGLIELYRTVFNRAQRLSLDLGINSPAVNQQLLLAISRLEALYMLLGNEALADALDPTIGFGSQTVINNGAVLPLDYGAFASSLFCFANQVPTLLDEELALLRGRGTPALAPGVSNYPYYNRLVWNFTRGLDAGEVAYAVNYNIHSSAEPTISAETAAALYPQGHGDAYGHYLSAVKGYYYLLRNPNFSWGDPAISPLLLGYQTISADYNDETRFAEASAALARTGVEIARRATRKSYTGEQNARTDSDANRAWGAADWIERTGMGAFYNWAVAQSLLPSAQGPVPVEGNIQNINRDTVSAVREIASHFRSLQKELDQMDQGLNPLGLDQDSVPFDISASEIDAGKTHFEQVYDRAVTALANAKTTFDAVQESARLLRQQTENALQFEESVSDQEQEYNNSLVEVFGYPFADDIGPNGTYEQGYDGPDLIHFAYMDLQALGFDRSTEIGTISITTNSLAAAQLAAGGTLSGVPVNSTSIVFHLAANGLQAKPVTWTGERRAEGEIQRAYRDFLVAFLELRSAKTTSKNDLDRLSGRYDWYHTATTGWYATRTSQTNSIASANSYVENLGYGIAAADTVSIIAEAYLMQAPVLDGAIGPFPVVEKDSFGSPIAAIAFGAAEISKTWMEAASQTRLLDLEASLAQSDFKIQDQEMRMEILDLARQQQESAQALMTSAQKLSDAQAQSASVLAKGERVLEERAGFRTAAAARIAASRYNDMTFRVFRNDALRRYSDAFELAARYCYLAARAYDYETGLLNAQSADSSLTGEIVHARTIGRLAGNTPLLGTTGIGEPGLADILARLAANWTVLHGRLGFNNPETETGRFSLRSELFRIAPGTAGDALWRQTLFGFKVDDLFSVPEFRRNCLPFASQAGLNEQEPGIVIPFSSTVDFARNFFGRDLAGGDNAYDSSHFATKIRSVGVWFTDYDRVTDGSQSVYLANQPRIYLLPLGRDILRSPASLGSGLREWDILDQAIPVPFPAEAGDIDAPDWIPLYDTLPTPWAATRRYSSMRAYHDHGFNAAEMSFNSRLVGRSVWNTRWLLIIPAGTLHHDRTKGLDWFIGGSSGTNGISDIKLFFQTYSYSGN